MSFRHFLLLVLFLLFLHALAFIFSVTRSFSLPEFSFSIRARRRGAWAVLRGGLAALCLVSRFGRAALFCVAWICADARVIQVIPGEVLHSHTHAHRLSTFQTYRCASVLPVIDLAPRGEDGMVASVEETESSVSSTSSGRHSAALPIVGPPRGLLARVSREGKSFSGFFYNAHICCSDK